MTGTVLPSRRRTLRVGGWLSLPVRSRSLLVGAGLALALVIIAMLTVSLGKLGVAPADLIGTILGQGAGTDRIDRKSVV